MTNCICGEINARNCPVHQVNYREFWINFPISYPDSPDKLATVDDIPLSDSLHVIEYQALQTEQERNAKLQKELNEARAEIEKLIQDVMYVDMYKFMGKQYRQELDWAQKKFKELRLDQEQKEKQITELLEALDVALAFCPLEATWRPTLEACRNKFGRR